MKGIEMLLFFLLLICINVHGWISSEQTDNTKDHPGYCYSEDKEVGAMERGEVKTKKNECVRVDCLDGGLINFTKCETNKPPDCQLGPEDLSKPYPKCCPGFSCIL